MKNKVTLSIFHVLMWVFILLVFTPICTLLLLFSLTNFTELAVGLGSEFLRIIVAVGALGITLVGGAFGNLLAEKMQFKRKNIFSFAVAVLVFTISIVLIMLPCLRFEVCIF